MKLNPKESCQGSDLQEGKLDLLRLALCYLWARIFFLISVKFVGSYLLCAFGFACRPIGFDCCSFEADLLLRMS